MVIYFLAKRGQTDSIRRYLRSTIGGQYARKVIPLTYEKLFVWMTKEYWLQEAKKSWWEWGMERRAQWPFMLEKLHAGRMLAAQLSRYVFARSTLPKGVYVFADLERLTEEETLKAVALWRTLAESGCGVRFLNHPTRSMRRYELLRTLYERGINQFDVYRTTEARWPKRYPVFLRFENDHGGARSPLLRTRAELDEALLTLEREHHQRDDILIVEFCDTADANGVYRKYGAFMVGGHVFPKNVQFSKHWVVKATDFAGEEMLDEERRYVETNPHAGSLKEIFALARIEYGRIDYGMLVDAIQVWEINTNPHITSRGEKRSGPRSPIYDALERRMAIALEELMPE